MVRAYSRKGHADMLRACMLLKTTVLYAAGCPQTRMMRAADCIPLKETGRDLSQLRSAQELHALIAAVGTLFVSPARLSRLR